MASDARALHPAHCSRFDGACADFLRDPHWRTASAARLSRAGPTWPRLYLGRGLSIGGGRTLQMARWVLDASALLGRVLGRALLRRRSVLHRALGRLARQRRA